MLQVEKIDTTQKLLVEEFIRLPYKLYANCPQWVPPFYTDMRFMLNRQKHPYYEHSDVDYFLARRDGEVVGRIAALENKPFNKFHQTKKGTFYFFDAIDDQEVANALFDRAFEWQHKRGIEEVVGPKGLGAFDGYGILAEGFQHRQMMTMMNYNYEYYVKLVTNYGFEKELDFVSCYINPKTYQLPEKAREVARRVKERGTFQIKTFKNKREVMQWAYRIGHAYNEVFVNNWEYYPLSDKEIDFLRDNLLAFAEPRLLELILRNDEPVGFLLAFPDVSDAMQRAKGKITPWGMVDLLVDMKRTKWVSLNGAGIKPEYHGRGGNALLYAEMERIIRESGFEHAEQTQMADTAVQVRKDMISLGADIYKAHRIFRRAV